MEYSLTAGSNFVKVTVVLCSETGPEGEGGLIGYELKGIPRGQRSGVSTVLDCSYQYCTVTQGF